MPFAIPAAPPLAPKAANTNTPPGTAAAGVPDRIDRASATGAGPRQRIAVETCCHRYRSHRHGTRPALAASPAPGDPAAARKGLLP